MNEMDIQNLTEKDKKFLFNVNIFDEVPDEEIDAVEEQEEEPPPPVFSEEELEAAKNEAFEKGKREAQEASKTSKEQLILQTLQQIAQDYGTLFAQEAERDKKFEHDAVHLCLEIVKKIGPVFEEKHGLEELEKVMHDVLAQQKEQTELTIHVATDIVDNIKTRFSNEESSMNKNQLFDIHGNETLKPGECQIKWKDGGATRSSEKLIQQIIKEMEQVLAVHAGKIHDNVEEEKEDLKDIPTEQANSEQASSVEMEKPDE